MARIRSVHPGPFTDDAFLNVPYEARLLFIGLLTESDDRGIFKWRATTLKVRLFPVDPVDIIKTLHILAAENMIRDFHSDGQHLGAIRNFCQWQRPKSPSYLFPIDDDVAKFVSWESQEPKKPADLFSTIPKLLCERQKGQCYYCHSEITYYRKRANTLEIDHKVSRKKNGTNDLNNLVAACKSCNILKKDMSVEEFLSIYSREKLAELCMRKVYGKKQLATGSVALATKSVANANGEIGNATALSQPAKVEKMFQREEIIGGDKREEILDSSETDFSFGDPIETESPVSLSSSASATKPPLVSASELKQAVALWNDVARDLSLAQCQNLSDTRKGKLRARLADCGGLDGWKIAMAKVRASKFLRGERTDFRCSFKFLLQAESFTSLMEGAYDDNHRKTTVARPGTRQGLAEAVRDVGERIRERTGRSEH
jgi:hypothetical protein